MTPEEMTDHDLLVRIDERVKQLCETTEKNVKRIGSIEEQSNQNQEKIENQINEDIDEVEEEIAWNRRYYIIGIIFLIVIGIAKDLWI